MPDEEMGPLEYIEFLRAKIERIREAHQHLYPKPGCPVCAILYEREARLSREKSQPGP